MLDADAEVPEGTPAVYSVESGAVVATVYTAEGLEEALAEGYATVRLGDDIQGNFTISKALTLDLNGKRLYSTNNEVYTLNAWGGESEKETISVEIISSANEKGTLEGAGIALNAYKYIDLTVRNVSFVSENASALQYMVKRFSRSKPKTLPLRVNWQVFLYLVPETVKRLFLLRPKIARLAAETMA